MSQTCHPKRTALHVLYLPQNFGMLKTGQINFGLGLSPRLICPVFWIVPQNTIFKDNKKADIMTTVLMATGLNIKNCLELTSVC